MTERIIIYGVNNIEFPTEQILKDYLSADLFLAEQGRFRYTQCKNADIIILSKNGSAYGHLIIKGKVDPTIEDRTAFKPVKCTYLVSESVVYHNPVKLYKDFGIRISSIRHTHHPKTVFRNTKKSNVGRALPAITILSP